MGENEKKGEEEVAVKLSGKTLKTVIALKHKLEEDSGTIVSVVEVIREAVKVMARNRKDISEPSHLVKISGNTLKQVITVRGNREKNTGRIKSIAETSIAELVREAIECWYDLEGGK